jgi:hypothetical protein
VFVFYWGEISRRGWTVIFFLAKTPWVQAQSRRGRKRRGWKDGVYSRKDFSQRRRGRKHRGRIVWIVIFSRRGAETQRWDTVVAEVGV